MSPSVSRKVRAAAATISAGGSSATNRRTSLKEMYEAVVEGKPILHHGRWALATTEVGAAMVQSGKERREIMLSHQCEIGRYV